MGERKKVKERVQIRSGKKKEKKKETNLLKWDQYRETEERPGQR